MADPLGTKPKLEIARKAAKIEDGDEAKAYAVKLMHELPSHVRQAVIKQLVWLAWGELINQVRHDDRIELSRQAQTNPESFSDELDPGVAEEPVAGRVPYRGTPPALPPISVQSIARVNLNSFLKGWRINGKPLGDMTGNEVGDFAREKRKLIAGHAAVASFYEQIEKKAKARLVKRVLSDRAIARLCKQTGADAYKEDHGMVA